MISAKTGGPVPRRLPDRCGDRRPPGGRGGRRWPAYGDNLGIAFQLVDDALDYSARQAMLGKTVGDDFRDGKITLPVLLAFARGAETERAFWRRTLEEQRAEPDRPRARAGTDRPARRHRPRRWPGPRATRGKAKAGLAGFPSSRAKQAMLDLLDFCTERAY